jgi:hypothetical protein
MNREYSREYETHIKNKKILITIKGFFVNYDMFNRAKLMFLDDYDGDLSKTSFAKSYMTKKAEKTPGYTPMVEGNKYMLIKCPKNALGYLPNISKNRTNRRINSA